MVGRHRGDDRHIGIQAQERAVELIGLNGQAITLAEDHIAVKILRDTTQKGVATHARSRVEPRNHRGCGGLAVCASYGHNILSLREMTKHLRAFLHQETTLAEVLHLRMVLRNGGGIDNHRCRGVAERLGDSIHLVLVGHLGTLGLQGASQRCFGAVVACNLTTLVQEVACKGTHSDAANAKEIYVWVVFHFLLFLYVL